MLADAEGRGFLTQSTFYKALKWIAIAQSGKVPDVSNLNTSKWIVANHSFYVGAGLPIFEGDDLASNSVPVTPIKTPTSIIASQITGSSVNSNMTGSGSQMTINSDERERFTAAFVACGPVDGLISGIYFTKLIK